MKLSSLITRIIDIFYIKPLSTIMPLQVFRYGACAIANVLLGILVYWLAYHFIIPYDYYLDLIIVKVSPHIQALFIQIPVTFIVGFWLNKTIAFRASTLQNRTQLIRYAISVAGALLLNYLLTKFFVEKLHIYPTYARIPTEIIVALYSFMMSKFFTFKGNLPK